MTKTIEVPTNILALCVVKAAKAADLTRDEITSLMSWCDCQREDLWDGMGLQEILNVYRVSASWDNFEGMEEEDPKAARAAWNRVVTPSNRVVDARA